MAEARGLRVALISASPTIKMAVNLRRVTNFMEQFDLVENQGTDLEATWPDALQVIQGLVATLNPADRKITLKDGRTVSYGQLCVATGASPKFFVPNHPRIVALRDTESVSQFQQRLCGKSHSLLGLTHRAETRRILIVGNGGIATEVAHELRGCEVVWAVRHSSISTPFLDPDAARFLLNARRRNCDKTVLTGEAHRTIRKLRYALRDSGQRLTEVESGKEFFLGSALGPDWAEGRSLTGALGSDAERLLFKVLYQVEVAAVMDQLAASGSDEMVWPEESEYSSATRWPVYARLTNGRVVGCDLIVSATGVLANVGPFTQGNPGLECASAAEGGGLKVNENMQTLANPDIFAVGDAAFCAWPDQAQHWFQMRLWSQARHMGFQAAKSMLARRLERPMPMLDIAFEMFTHVTTFFGFKVVMIGCYNGQKMDLTDKSNYLLLRITPGVEYVKCVMHEGRMQGALLIGETDLEECFENLIMDKLNIKDTEDGLLDPDIDIDDYYD